LHLDQEASAFSDGHIPKPPDHVFPVDKNIKSPKTSHLKQSGSIS